MFTLMWIVISRVIVHSQQWWKQHPEPLTGIKQSQYTSMAM